MKHESSNISGSRKMDGPREIADPSRRSAGNTFCRSSTMTTSPRPRPFCLSFKEECWKHALLWQHHNHKPQEQGSKWGRGVLSTEQETGREGDGSWKPGAVHAGEIEVAEACWEEPREPVPSKMKPFQCWRQSQFRRLQQGYRPHYLHERHPPPCND